MKLFVFLRNHQKISMKIFLLILLGVVVVGIVAFSFILGAFRRLLKGAFVSMNKQQPQKNQQKIDEVLYSKDGVTISKGEANQQ